MTTPHKAATASLSFFQKERDRLIAEIADGIEQLLGNTNTLNRKLEESIAVGQEFEPISNLWGQFVDIISASGLHPQTAMEATAGKTQADAGQAMPSSQVGSASMAARNDNRLGKSGGSDEVDETLPPGVAPGGGVIYGRQ